MQYQFKKNRNNKLIIKVLDANIVKRDIHDPQQIAKFEKEWNEKQAYIKLKEETIKKNWEETELEAWDLQDRFINELIDILIDYYYFINPNYDIEITKMVSPEGELMFNSHQLKRIKRINLPLFNALSKSNTSKIQELLESDSRDLKKEWKYRILDFFRKNKENISSPKGFNFESYMKTNYEELYPLLLTEYVKRLVRIFHASFDLPEEIEQNKNRENRYNKMLLEMEKKRETEAEHERAYEMKYGKRKLEYWEEQLLGTDSNIQDKRLFLRKSKSKK